MKISAQVRNQHASHEVLVSTAGSARALVVSAKQTGFGSSVNGGEFLMLALATCYCNDLYREAERLGIPITGCEVVASAEFDGVGLAAREVAYAARVESIAPPAEIERLLVETDRVAEIHRTLRDGCQVRRLAWDAMST